MHFHARVMVLSKIQLFRWWLNPPSMFLFSIRWPYIDYVQSFMCVGFFSAGICFFFQTDWFFQHKGNSPVSFPILKYFPISVFIILVITGSRCFWFVRVFLPLFFCSFRSYFLPNFFLQDGFRKVLKIQRNFQFSIFFGIPNLLSLRVLLKCGKFGNFPPGLLHLFKKILP